MRASQLKRREERLLNRFDIDEGAGRSDGARHRHRQEERAAFRACRLRGDEIRAHIFDDVDAVVREQDGVNGESLFRVFRRDHLDRPVIGADEDDLLVREPVRGRLAKAGLARL